MPHFFRVSRSADIVFLLPQNKVPTYKIESGTSKPCGIFSIAYILQSIMPPKIREVAYSFRHFGKMKFEINPARSLSVDLCIFKGKGFSILLLLCLIYLLRYHNASHISCPFDITSTA